MEYGPYSICEKDAAEYILPDPLMTNSGKRINTAAEWHNFQRSEIMKLLQKYEYGEILPRPDEMSFQLLNCRKDALHGKAVRKEVRISCSMFGGESISFTILIYLPAAGTAPVPAFLGLNFHGNQNTTLETDVIPTGFIRSGELAAEGNGEQHSRWIPEEIVSRGYASITCCYHDIFPDRLGGESDSVFKLFSAPGKTEVPGEKYSVIGAWSWGLSRIMDYLEHDPDIDNTRVALHGHSRLGKTSLWAGAVDTRFKMVISNDSGC
ncbi:MAG: acetylxylan esterase, partial [Lentisphaeria bacterium]|nr:acetylxylan esterase [Lentisphaeria bacterium]